MYRFNNHHRVVSLIFLTGMLISACKAERTNPRDLENPNYINTLYFKLSSKPSNITEGTISSIGVSLSEVVDVPLEVTISSDNDAVTVDGLDQTTLTFTPENSTVYQMVTLNAIEDDDLVSNIVMITVNSGKTTDEVFSVTAIDNDVQNISLTGDTAAYEGGSTATLSIHLTQQPSSNVEVSLNSGETATAAVSPGTITFTPLNWNSNQTAVVTAVNDADHDSKNVTITASAAGVSNREHNVSCFDNDTTFIFGGVNGIHEGQTGRKITVKLSGNPLDPRTAGITSLDTGRVTVSPASLVFNPANYMNPQEVTLTGLPEAADVDDNNVSILAAAEYIVSSSKTVAFCEKRIILDSTPANAATGVDPSYGIIEVTFSGRSNYFEVPTAVEIKVFNNTTNVPVATNSTMIWLDEDTLQVDLNLVRLPENIKIYWALIASFIDSSQATRTFTTTVLDHTYPAVDTGQTALYYYNSVWYEDLPPYETYIIGSSTYPYGQDVHYVKTARGLSTPVQHSTYTSDYTTSDSVTGLTWKTCSEGADYTGSTCGTSGASTWVDSFTKCEDLNKRNSGAGYAGIKTWRLPTIYELLTIVDLSEYNPTIKTDSFPGTPGSVSYWSATGFADPSVEGRGRKIAFQWGIVDFSNLTASNMVRCVSGP